MPQSLVQFYTHIVFSTKNRVPHLNNLDHQTSLYKFLKRICDNLDSPIVEIGGIADHIHILCRLSSGVAIKTLILELKRDSSKFVKTLSPELSEFLLASGLWSVFSEPIACTAID